MRGQACDTPRLTDGDHPEDAVILEPRSALDQRPQIQLVCPGRGRSHDRELEPRGLSWTDVVGGLHGDAVISWPARVGRAEMTVTAKRCGRILSRLGPPRSKVRDLAHASAHPADGP